MSLGNIKTYGSKWGTNYPWQKAMLNATQSSIKVDNFTTTNGQASYTRPNLNNRTITSLLYDQTVLGLGDYTLVGDILTFTVVPNGTYNVIVYYT